MDTEAWIVVLQLPVLFGLIFVIVAVVELLKKLFPCAGDLLHPDLVYLNRDNCICRRCGKKWKVVDRVYSIASTDEDSYLPVWEEH
jgi:hypothetical protein